MIFSAFSPITGRHQQLNLPIKEWLDWISRKQQPLVVTQKTTKLEFEKQAEAV